ncbi:MAG: hypothetical protein ACYCZL_08345 [Polaromonas sp.]
MKLITRIALMAGFCVMVLNLAGCATYKTTLTDANGRKITCEASGKNGLLTGYYLRSGFDNCVKNAEAHGFKQ